MPTLATDSLTPLRARLSQANLEIARRYPGEGSTRQPVHTVYGGAHLFRADSTRKLGAAAVAALESYAPSAQTFANAIGLPPALAETIYQRVLEKLRDFGREQVHPPKLGRYACTLQVRGSGSQNEEIRK